MAELTRVVPPKSPFNGRWGRLAGVVGVALVVAIVKPWPDSSRPDPGVFDWGSVTPPPSAGPTPRTVHWDPAELGPDPPAPAWEIWAGGQTTRVRFVGPPDGFLTPSPTASGLPEPAPSAVIGGPVIELGTSDEVAALGINRPVDTDLAAVRLWRFTDGGRPERVLLTELAAPWRDAPFTVFGRRGAGLSRGELAPWEPGLYRLDILIDPVDRIRSLLLVVRPGDLPPGAGPAGVPRESPPLDPRLLRRLPDAAVVWSFDRILTGWGRKEESPNCRVAELWRAANYHDPCYPIPVGQATAIGVNLPPDRVISSIALREVDPLPGPVDAAVTTATEGRSGLAVVTFPTAGIPDGIYRLDIETADGDRVHYYVEAGG